MNNDMSFFKKTDSYVDSLLNQSELIGWTLMMDIIFRNSKLPKGQLLINIRCPNCLNMVDKDHQMDKGCVLQFQNYHLT
ncbi:hypothetical protein SPHINGO8BC_50331 [Sphingobacterium multivorum]|uniref:Uncharacterized protein n=1 Tax=Sphingobacterium multivorum TaxID=28454 RepID=A0A654BVX8_SPHMU|nr:hypothetical protein SPHINGO8BC_50331 [Sphingobacterium multivorum]